MANWDILKQSIANVIKTNNNREITGASLQSILHSIVSNVGANATFAGIATPATNPGTPDGPVFYFAFEPGIYVNFSGITAIDGALILTWNNGSWSSTPLGFASAKFAKTPYITDGEKSDLDVADDEGNVITRFKNGHIKTQKFNSETDCQTSVVNGEDAELRISDPKGNVIAEFRGGHLKTKNFDSRDCGSGSEVKGYKYEGEKIDVKSYQYTKELLFTESNSSSSYIQGSACFGKYLFQFYDTNDTIDVFNLEEKSFTQTIRLTAVSTYHCNNANFGNEYYTQSDEFPLLYVSQENVAEHKCLVYRVIGTEGSWSVKLVQTITLPTPSDDFMWYPNCIIDTQNSKLIAAGLGNNPWSPGTNNVIRYKVFSLPKLNKGNVTLSLSDIEDSIEVKHYSTTQGGFILNNKIYQVFGMSDSAQLNVTDLSTHKVISKINITGDGINVEPEGCFLYDNSICVNFVNGQIIKFNF